MVEDFERDNSQRKEDRSEKKINKSGSTKAESPESLSLQELMGALESDPSLIRHLPFQKLEEIALTIGNHRLEMILGADGTDLYNTSFDIADKETGINDISTETPELICLEGE